MEIRIDTNFSAVEQWLGDVEKQARFAAAQAINETAKDVQRELRADLPRAFDRPTPYISNSIRITAWAKRDSLTAVIEPKYLGGKGVDPQNVLRAEIFGGKRKLKRSEVALRRVGILPPGYITTPGEACPLDEFGNVRGSFIVQLLSYFQAFGEQGYRANMTAKRKAKLANRGLSPNKYRTINGVEYFVSYGRLRGGVGAWLHPGIWSRTGIHGSTVRPILMFVPEGSYKPRYDFFGKAEKVARKQFPQHFDRTFANALRTAR